MDLLHNIHPTIGPISMLLAYYVYNYVRWLVTFLNSYSNHYLLDFSMLCDPSA